MKGDTNMKRKKKINPYDLQEAKLNELLNQLQPLTPEYEKAQLELGNVHKLREASRESRKRFAKAERAGFWGKVVGGVFTLIGLGGLAYYETKGGTFTGEKRKAADGLVGIITRFIKP